MSGASVTIPFKLDALEAAQHADDLARAVGAANTLRRRAGVIGCSGLGPATTGDWDATNTDVQGFLDPLEAIYPRPLRGARAAVIGAGGAARAVAVALLSRGARVTVHARRREQAYEVAAACHAEAGSWPPPPGSWDLLVNCTPLGGPNARAESPLPGGPFDGTLVYDLTATASTRRRCCARPARRGASRLTACRCSSRRRSGSSSGGPDNGPSRE